MTIQSLWICWRWTIYTTATLLIGVSIFFHPKFAQAQSNIPTTSTWVTNGRVYSIACTSTTIYLGGSFSLVGPATTTTGWITRNHIAALDARTGIATNWNPNIDGNVLSLAVANGVVYAGGTFNNAGGQTHKGLVALDATTGQAKPWNPNMVSSYAVNTILVSGSTIYVGGGFTSLDGQAGLNYLGALNAETGHPTGWNPKANNYVTGLALTNGILYACGGFTNIGGQPRSYIAALDTVTTNPTVWNPLANFPVNNLLLIGSILYTGGDFTLIGGLPRNRLAAFDITTGQPTDWNPDANNSVYLLAQSGNLFYAGGSFTTIGRQVRNKLATLNLTTGLPTIWNPNPNGALSAVVISSSTLYTGGNYTTIAGQARPYFAQFDPLPPLGAPYNPGATDIQTDRITWTWSDNAVGETGFKVWADSGAGAPATLRTTTSANATSWTYSGLTPNTQYAFQSAATDGFTDSSRSPLLSRYTLPALPRYGLNVACDHTTGTSLGWHTNLTFTNPAGFGPGTHGGDPWRVSSFRYSWDNATIHTFTGTEAVWNADPLILTHNLEGNYYLHLQSRNTELVSGAKLDIGPFVFGPFVINPPLHGALSQIPTTSTWGTDDVVRTIACTSTTIYIGGDFRNVGPANSTDGWVPRGHIAAFDAATGRATTWAPGAEYTVYNLAVSSSTVYAGGDFSRIGGTTRYGLAALDEVTGQALPWDPMKTYETPSSRFSCIVSALAVSSSSVYIGGKLTWLPLSGDPGSATIRNIIAAINKTTGQITEWNSPQGMWVNSLIASGSRVYMGGSFNNISGQARKGIALFNSTNGILLPWNPNPDSNYPPEVDGFLTNDSTIYVGGNFTSIGGQARNRIAELDATTGNATDWDPNASSSPYIFPAIASFEKIGGAIIAGGGFRIIGGKYRNNLAALDPTTGMATDWNPNVNDSVLTQGISGTSLYIGGLFTTIGGQPRPHLARFDLLTSPMIQSQPQPQTVIQGATAKFGITALGKELTFQWFKNGVLIQNGGRISGANSPSLTLNSTQFADAGFYSCSVSNSAGTSNSQGAQLIVNPVQYSNVRNWNSYPISTFRSK